MVGDAPRLVIPLPLLAAAHAGIITMDEAIKATHCLPRRAGDFVLHPRMTPEGADIIGRCEFWHLPASSTRH